MATMKGLSMKGILGSAKEIPTNSAIIAVLSASIVTPIIAPSINQAIKSVGILNAHVTTSAIIPAILLFWVAKKFPQNSIVSPMIIGVAGSFVLTAIMPFISPFLLKVKA